MAKLAGNDGTAKFASTFYVMPNQLSKSKRRQSLAEHEAVLAALAEIARREDTTVMALLREAARDVVRKRAAVPSLANAIRTLGRVFKLDGTRDWALSRRFGYA